MFWLSSDDGCLLCRALRVEGSFDSLADAVLRPGPSRCYDKHLILSHHLLPTNHWPEHGIINNAATPIGTSHIGGVRIIKVYSTQVLHSGYREYF